MRGKRVEFITRQNGMARAVPPGPNNVTFLISAEEAGGNFFLNRNQDDE